eukprot:6175557-Pleurochrysis_carterae.AAC.2
MAKPKGCVASKCGSARKTTLERVKAGCSLTPAARLKAGRSREISSQPTPQLRSAQQRGVQASDWESMKRGA